jgi:hypothetical protein
VARDARGGAYYPRARIVLFLCIYTLYIKPWGFEWDPEKAAENLRTHGIAFEDAIHIFDDRTIEIADTREDYGEDRIVAFGVVQGIEVAVVYTERKDVIRLISARRATRNERKAYWQVIRGQG